MTFHWHSYSGGFGPDALGGGELKRGWTGGSNGGRTGLRSGFVCDGVSAWDRMEKHWPRIEQIGIGNIEISKERGPGRANRIKMVKVLAIARPLKIGALEGRAVRGIEKNCILRWVRPK